MIQPKMLPCPHCNSPLVCKDGLYKCEACGADFASLEPTPFSENAGGDARLITVVGEDGKRVDFEVVIDFEFKEDQAEFMVYTRNEIDEDDKVTVYVSAVDRSEETPVLKSMNDKDWERVKEVLDEITHQPD